MSKKSISNKIIRINAEDLPDNFLGVAVNVDETKDPSHAAIFIRYNGESFVLHYDSKDVLLIDIEPSNLQSSTYFKHLALVPSELMPSIFNYFQIVQDKARPKYGYYYTRSFYDLNSGDFIDENSMPEVMSCVGFCLNVLKTCMLQNDFVHFEDWSLHNGITDDSILKFYKKIKDNYPNITLEDYKKGVRRILPIEYFTAGFSKEFPVRKEFTDVTYPSVKKALLDKAS